MGGHIVLDNSAGRALRREPAPVRARDVLDCAGGFAAGDTVYITFRAIDGGQYAIATGVVGCGEDMLRPMLGTPSETVIIREQDLNLLW